MLVEASPPAPPGETPSRPTTKTSAVPECGLRRVLSGPSMASLVVSWPAPLGAPRRGAWPSRSSKHARPYARSPADTLFRQAECWLTDHCCPFDGQSARRAPRWLHFAPLSGTPPRACWCDPVVFYLRGQQRSTANVRFWPRARVSTSAIEHPSKFVDPEPTFTALQSGHRNQFGHSRTAHCLTVRRRLRWHCCQSPGSLDSQHECRCRRATRPPDVEYLARERWQVDDRQESTPGFT